jgi:hypothetical protein
VFGQLVLRSLVLVGFVAGRVLGCSCPLEPACYTFMAGR